MDGPPLVVGLGDEEGPSPVPSSIGFFFLPDITSYFGGKGGNDGGIWVVFLSQNGWMSMVWP